MKVEEAREILKSVREKGFRYTMYTLGQFHEALDMAIEALEQKLIADRVEYGTDGNAYRLIISNGKEFKQEPICPSAGVDCEDCPAYEPKWTPISERLPEDGKWAIFTDGKNMSIERYKSDAIDHFFPEGRWFSFENVIAWMPLPKPYTESEK